MKYKVLCEAPELPKAVMKAGRTAKHGSSAVKNSADLPRAILPGKKK